MKKILLALAFFAPLVTQAAFAVPFNATSTSQGWIYPVKINGVEQTVLSQNFISTSTSLTNIFPILNGTSITGFGLTTCNNSNSALTWSGGTFGCNAISGGSGGTDVNWSFFNNSGIRVATTSNTVLIGGSSTTSLATLEIQGSFLTTSSSTLQAFTFTNATGSKATTTSFAITSILSKLLKTDGNGSVIGAVAGTDYENPLTFSTGLTRTVDTITVDTTQNISTLSNLTSNGFVKTSGGTGALSIDTTTYTPTTRTLTVAGTANQITSSAGAQNLSANRTWTLSLPSHVIFPGNFQVTNSTTTNATTTALDVTGTLTFNGVTGSAWSDFCTTITGSASLCDGSDATGSGGTGLATSTDIADTQVIYGTSASDVGAEAAFTYDDATNILSVDHYLANGSSTLQDFTFVNATGSAATTTNFFSNTASTSNLYLATGACSGSSALTVNSSGKTVCGTLAPTAGSITGAGNITRTNDTNVTLTLGGTPTGATLNSVSFTLGWTGTLADSRVADNLTISGGTIDNSPIGNSTPSTGIFTNATSTTLSTTKASTTDLWVSNVASALVLTDSAGKAGKYAGTSCTNQFPRSLSATGSATCATVANTDLANSTISGISLGSNLANLTATDSTLTFSGTYNGSTARTIGLNLANANTWTGGQTFGNATTTNFAVSSKGFSVGNTGQYVTATTTGTLSVASTTLGIDSSTFAAGTTTQSLHLPEGRKLTSIGCQVSAGTSLTVEIGTGSASSTVICTTTFARTYPSTNNTFTADQRIYIGIGSKSGTPDRIEIDPTWFKTAP